jgi:hypothetical protein
MLILKINWLAACVLMATTSFNHAVGINGCFLRQNRRWLNWQRWRNLDLRFATMRARSRSRADQIAAFFTRNYSHNKYRTEYHVSNDAQQLNHKLACRSYRLAVVNADQQIRPRHRYQLGGCAWKRCH